MSTATSELGPGLHFAVSTGSFLDFSRGKSIAIGALLGNPDLHEVEPTYRVAEELGIGVEVAYRVLGTDSITLDSATSSAETVSVHMPIFPTRRRFFQHGFPVKSMITNYAASEFGLGFGDTSLKNIKTLAALHPRAVFVAHPDMALWLHNKLAYDDPFRLQVGVEADWPSIPNSPRLISEDTKVVEIIDEGGFVANPDTSHNSLTKNPLIHRISESLTEMVQTYGPRLRRIHFSANIPYPEGTSPAGWPGGSLPLNSEYITPEVIAQYHQWYKETDAMLKRIGLRVDMPIEVYGWGKARYEDRPRGIELTMNALVTGNLGGDSRSYPNAPTRDLRS